MNPELRRVIDTIIGIKLYGISHNSSETVRCAEDIYIDSIGGDDNAVQIAALRLAEIELHNPYVALRAHNDHAMEYDSKRTGLSGDVVKKSLESRYQGSDVLSYGSFSAVHATDLEPREYRGDGRLHIEDRFTTSGTPRSTVHVALNHLVEASAFSDDWSGKRVIVVAPLDEVVEMNGKPSSLVGHDTWWEVIPGEGLVLPEDTIIIKPGASKPVQVQVGGHEIRYKVQGITPDDVTELVGTATDFELRTIARYLGLSLDAAYAGQARGESLNLGDEGVPLTSEDHDQIISKLKDVAEQCGKTEPHPAVYLAKLVAVRRALELQGRDHMEPMTTHEGHFRSPQLNEEHKKFLLTEVASGIHSDSYVGKLENMLMSMVEEADAGVLTEDRRARIAEHVRNHRDFLGIGTLHMCYRLGVL